MKDRQENEAYYIGLAIGICTILAYMSLIFYIGNKLQRQDYTFLYGDIKEDTLGTVELIVPQKELNENYIRKLCVFENACAITTHIKPMADSNAVKVTFSNRMAMPLKEAIVDAQISDLKFKKFQKLTLILGLLLASGLVITIFLHKVTSVY